MAGGLESRVHAELDQHGLGMQALRIPENLIRHELSEPRAVPPLVRELLARPLAAADAASLFERSVPPSIQQFRRLPAPRASVDFDTLLAQYVRETSLDGLARLVIGLRAPGLAFPPPQTRATRIGLVVIGSPGADRHGPEAALILEPGGDDRYERRPPPPGGVSVVIDLAGNDRYGGSALAEGAFAAIIDLAGNDRYAVEGLAAAREGISLVLDAQGDDHYEAGAFALGAAAGAESIGALIDLAGNDRYRVHARGQGYAAEGGLGLLWDAAGDDHYLAAGEPDFWRREAGLSFAQGVAAGERSTVAGGTGILRDEAGDDRYEAQMFAQGSGYYFALGLLWDGGGADRYQAVRYAQGAGVHQAVGVLRDESGDDDYRLGGVGQGTGHDMALGLLLDRAGDDRYAARYAGQGTGLANGIGLLADLAGTDQWHTPGDRAAEEARGLPSIGLILERKARFAPVRAAAAALQCPPVGAALPLEEGFIDALRAVGRDLAAGKSNPAYERVIRTLLRDPAAALAQVPPLDFSALWALGLALPCAAALEPRIWSALERILAEHGASPYAAAIANAAKEQPAQAQRLRPLLERHPSCAVRAEALRAWPNEQRAREALASACWREQAAALKVLGTAGGPTLPRFLQKDSP